MGKRKQQLMTGMTKEQRIKWSIKRKEEERKEETRRLARAIAMELEMRKKKIEAMAEMTSKNPAILHSVKER